MGDMNRKEVRIMKITIKKHIAVFSAITAAVLYSISSPVSKLLLSEIPPALMASLLYLGAGFGMASINLIQKKLIPGSKDTPFVKQDFPYIAGMILLDIAAPFLLMTGLSKASAANVSLLNNFEIVATSLIALTLFREKITGRLWFGIGLITLSSLILSLPEPGSLSFSYSSLFVLGACVCWGFENNCTRMLSKNSPLKVVIIKGFGSGTGSLLLSFLLHENGIAPFYIFCTLILGFVSYGLSIFCYVYAQRSLGAAKTSAYYSVSPFIGVFLSLIIFREIPHISFALAFLVMAAGTYYTSTDGKKIRFFSFRKKTITHVENPII